MKNKSVKLSAAIVLFSLVIVTFSVFTFLPHEQKPITTKNEFIKPIISDPNDFISVWDTTRTSSGSSDSNQVYLPLEWSGNYSFMVYWGDGSNETITTSNGQHTYASEGVYTITITGMIIGWCFNDDGDRLKIIEIEQWGCLRLGNSGFYFEGCSNLELTATDNLDLRGTTTLRGAFFDCENLGDSGNMNGWDVSNVTDMSFMFCIYGGTGTFNQPIGAWNVSSVTNMEKMFYFVTSFNQPIGNWDVSSVRRMDSLFAHASSFNQPIGNWDVSGVVDMGYMFYSALKFNQPLANWDVSIVHDMDHMFCGASSFNQPIGDWNVSIVINMDHMFWWADDFNQPLGNWNVSSVTNMEEMFYHVKLSTPNYDNLLLGWSLLTLQNNVSFHAGNSKYSSAAADARQSIITNFSWTITDGGLATPSSEIPGYILVLIVAVLGVTIVIVIKKKYDIKC